MDVIAGVEGLRPEHGPVFAVVGVFDGLHRGHTYLLEHLVAESAGRHAQPTVITFDHHPDEVLTGQAPPLLLHPDERLERLAAAGVRVTVVVHFDDVLQHTPYDRFIESIRERTALAGILMTPDAAFGFERRGTPDALAILGHAQGFEVVVIPTFSIDGRSVRSTEIREAIASGRLATARQLLGRSPTLTGRRSDGRLHFELPMATPPDGRYPGRIDGRPTVVDILDGKVWLSELGGSGPTSVELLEA